MKAPEKLYVDVNDNLSDSFLYGFTEKRKEDDIEYIRTDAFIEKVCEFLKENARKYTEKVNTIFGTIKVLNSHKLANDLKQAMKDE